MPARHATAPRAVLVIATLLGLLWQATPAAAQPTTFVVSSLADAGPGTLRDAMAQANAAANAPAGPDRITFAVAGVIAVTSPLPTISDAVVIEAPPGTLTIRAVGGAPTIVTGLTAAGGVRVEVSGLRIEGFEVGVRLTGAGRLTGSTVVGNVEGVHVTGSAATPQLDDNTLSDSARWGLLIDGGARPVVIGNRIGTTPDGGGALPNVFGIVVDGDGTSPTIGSAEAPNTISANTNTGVVVVAGARPVIAGNQIGTSDGGTRALGNLVGIDVGLLDGDDPSAPQIGSVDAPNTISGNGVGIRVRDRSVPTIVGNRIGTDVAGGAALGNTTGILVTGLGTAPVIGAADAPNTISGNRDDGVRVEGGASPTITGNLIGTDVGGVRALGNRVGISLEGEGTSAVIGSREAPNTIAASNLEGIRLGDRTRASIVGNRIGTAADGTTPSPNGVGIAVGREATPTIGATERPNVIAANRGPGVRVEAGGRPFIFAQPIGGDERGRDLGNDGPGIVYLDEQRNPTVGPVGAPAITGAVRAGDQLLVTGTAPVPAGERAIIAVYASEACDPSGAGEGARHLGIRTASGGDDGTATWSAAFDDAAAGVVTATSTGGEPSATSLFSACAVPTTATAPADDPPALDPADLTLELTGPGTATAGDEIALTGLVRNRSSATAEDAVVVLRLPEGVTAPDSSASCTTRGTEVRCPLGRLRGGGEATATIPLTPTRRGPVDLSATASSRTSDPTPADNTDRVTIDVDEPRTSPAAERVGRLDHADPIDTAIQLSRTRFPDGARRVVLARDDVFADALAAAPLTRDAPLLLTGHGPLDPRTRAEIGRLTGGDGEVYVLGGPRAISTGATDQLAADGLTATRLAGPTRVHTALAIADRLVADGADASRVVLARHDGPGTAAWADAIAVGPWAALTTTPILLTPTSRLDDDVARWLDANGTERSIVLGGTDAVEEPVARALPGSTRIGGPNRYATAAAVARELWGEEAGGAFQIAAADHDRGWAHALVAAGAAAADRTPQLLAETDRLPPETAAALGCADGRRPPVLLLGDRTHLGAALETTLEAPCATG